MGEVDVPTIGSHIKHSNITKAVKEATGTCLEHKYPGITYTSNLKKGIHPSVDMSTNCYFNVEMSTDTVKSLEHIACPPNYILATGTPSHLNPGVDKEGSLASAYEVADHT